MGPLTSVIPDADHIDRSIELVSEGMSEGQWNPNFLSDKLPQKLVVNIINNLPMGEVSQECDKPWWLLNPDGTITVKIAWGFLRVKRTKSWIFKKIWTNRSTY